LVLSLSLSKKVSGLDVSEPVGGWESLEPPAETPPEEPSENYPASEYGYYYAIISDSNGTTSFLNPVPKEDAMAEVPTDLKIGEKWTGPSGQIYIATAPASTEPGSEDINSTLSTTLVPYEEQVTPTPTNGDGGDGDGDGSTPTPTPDGGCGGCGQPACPVTPPPPVTPQYRCSQCRCQ
jgi:hypothetical protein